MHHSFWHQRWAENQIGFHLDTINPYLSTYWPTLKLPPSSRVFVPLCGKSKDLIYLYQQGHSVLGNELSELAVRDFYTEQRLNASKSSISVKNNQRDEVVFEYWQSPEVAILCGDFFAMQASQLIDISAVYDRAALVALPPDMRREYATKMLQILPPKVSMMLVTLEYDENEKQGPPFSVTREDVYSYYAEHFTINQVVEADIDKAHRNDRSKHLHYFKERVFILQR